jgi:lysylphosphatidylglycerol synthetase-like protein (DUF2156 family)
MRAIQRVLLWLLVFGLIGTALELALLEHYESGWQLIPFALIASTLVVLNWHARRRTRVARRAVQIAMAALVAGGVAGMALHIRGGFEFQRESDPEATLSTLYWKVMRGKAPPALAPGIMVQFGLLGLIYTSRLFDEVSTDTRSSSPTGGSQ